MIFMNNSLLFIGGFILSLIIQYIRYRRMSKNQFRISSLLVIKFLIRSLILCCLLIVTKNLTEVPQKSKKEYNNALFVINCKTHLNFRLSEDDQVNISSRIPELKYSELEIWLHNTSTRKYYIFIPKTSENTFRHLLKIERENKLVPKELIPLPDQHFNSLNRIEMYQSERGTWRRIDSNQDDFNFLQLIDFENELVSPFLVHYLLILAGILIAFDLSFKYRILKI